MEKESKIEKTETKEKEPKISYHIFYSSHRTPKDFENLEKAFLKADVYIPEVVGGDFELLREYNETSQGERSIDDFVEKYGI